MIKVEKPKKKEKKLINMQLAHKSMILEKIFKYYFIQLNSIK